jgi:hypothetical protein
VVSKFIWGLQLETTVLQTLTPPPGAPQTTDLARCRSSFVFWVKTHHPQIDGGAELQWR